MMLGGKFTWSCTPRSPWFLSCSRKIGVCTAGGTSGFEDHRVQTPRVVGELDRCVEEDMMTSFSLPSPESICYAAQSDEVSHPGEPRMDGQVEEKNRMRPG